MHSQFGGGTSRCRAVPVMELQYLHEVLPVSHLPSAPPSLVTAASEWVQAGSRPHLQLQQGLFTFTPAASRDLLTDAPTTVGTLRNHFGDLLESSQSYLACLQRCHENQACLSPRHLGNMCHRTLYSETCPANIQSSRKFRTADD